MVDLVSSEQFWTLERLGALLAFLMAGSWTPGPNNMMLANSGATFGFKRSIPHALGVSIGFSLMAFAVARGLGEVFQNSSLLREILRWGGAAMLLYIAYMVATAGRPGDGAKPGGRPLNFMEAAAFQWINPKAWMMVIGVASTYLVGGAPTAEAAAVFVAAMLAGVTSAHSWAAFGAALRDWLAVGSRLRVFNAVMGLSLTLFVIPILLI